MFSGRDQETEGETVCVPFRRSTRFHTPEDRTDGVCVCARVRLAANVGELNIPAAALQSGKGKSMECVSSSVCV